jgi:aminoacyl tRNA synthase complex-interacting multifunctional protein 1
MAVAAKVASVTLKINLLRSAIQSGAAVELRKQELLARNVELKAQVAAAVKELTALEVAHGKVQVQLPVKKVKEAPKASAPAPKAVESKPKPDLDPELVAKSKAKKAAKDAKKAAKPKAAAAANDSDKVVDLSRVKMMVGLIAEVSLHPDADGLYLEKMECGEAEPRQVISGLVKHVPIEQMKNRKVVMIANLKPAKMRGITSYGMVLCAKTGEKGAEKVELIRVPDCAQPGDIITTDDFLGENWSEADAQMNPKKKIFEQVAPELMTNGANVACYRGKPLLIKGKEEQTRGKFVSDSIANAPMS